MVNLNRWSSAEQVSGDVAPVELHQQLQSIILIVWIVCNDL